MDKKIQAQRHWETVQGHPANRRLSKNSNPLWSDSIITLYSAISHCPSQNQEASASASPSSQLQCNQLVDFAIAAVSYRAIHYFAWWWSDLGCSVCLNNSFRPLVVCLKDKSCSSVRLVAEKAIRQSCSHYWLPEANCRGRLCEWLL